MARIRAYVYLAFENISNMRQAYERQRVLTEHIEGFQSGRAGRPRYWSGSAARTARRTPASVVGFLHLIFYYSEYLMISAILSEVLGVALGLYANSAIPLTGSIPRGSV